MAQLHLDGTARHDVLQGAAKNRQAGGCHGLCEASCCWVLLVLIFTGKQGCHQHTGAKHFQTLPRNNQLRRL
jgi:hypothetical protein